MRIDRLTTFLENNDIKYTLDENPTPEKVSRIQSALGRKRDLISTMVTAYKQVKRIG